MNYPFIKYQPNSIYPCFVNN